MVKVFVSAFLSQSIKIHKFRSTVFIIQIEAHLTVVGFKLRGHFEFFFIIMSDLDTVLNERVLIV